MEFVMDVGTAIAVVGTVFSITFGLVKYFGGHASARLVDSLGSKISDLGTRIVDLSGKIESMNGKLDRLSTEQVKMETLLDGHKEDKDRLEKRIETLEAWRLEHVQGSGK